MRIQHNIMAMSAYRNYTNNVSAMKKNLEKLSSGYKINRAGDDAAGLAISEKMRAQITGLETAQKNAKDGISLVQTAEGALTEVHDMLNRMVELATQSANGTYDNDTDRYQLQKEMDQLRAEIDRIADSSNFNGIMLLDGSMDAGGDIKYTSGSFQINSKTMHPAGLADGSISLPDVGQILGQSTVLHANGTKGGDTNAFSIDLHNLSINAGKSIDIQIGDNLYVTVRNTSDTKAMNADDIVEAIAKGSANVSFTDAKGTAIKPSSGVIEIGGAKFSMTSNGTRLTFTQDKNDTTEIEMPKEITIKNTDPMDIDGYNKTIAKAGGTGADNATLTIDLSGLTVDKAGDILIDIGNGTIYKATISDQDIAEDKVAQSVVDQIVAQMKNDPVFTDTDGGVGAFTVKSSNNGQIVLESADTGTLKDANLSSLTVSITDANAVAGKYVGDDSTASEVQTVDVTIKWTDGSKAVNWKDNNFIIKNSTSNGPAKAGDTFDFAIGDKKLTLTLTSGGTADNQLNSSDLLGSNNKVSDWLAAINGKVDTWIKGLNTQAQTDATANGENGDYTEIFDYEVTANADGSGIQLTYKTRTVKYQEAPSNFSGDYNKSTTVLATKSEGTQDRLASTYFDLSKLADDDGKIAEGTTITIGRDTYTFTYDSSKIGKDGYVVLNGGQDNPDTLADIAKKLTEAAKANGTYTVGYDEDYTKDGFLNGRITITEKVGQTNFDLTTMEGIEKSLGFKIASTNPTDNSKGLTLQIGDTAESYNQLKVNIKDCHTKALGLDMISIANQADAADAVSSIKAAINYVSDVRGTLGATQNRLDHTINNLSVMTENIQDAESTVRDVDIAEEMMAYTKNNILIQSAQAMLAQANQVPQGVLQLLQ